jgi:hypothetical protein
MIRHIGIRVTVTIGLMFILVKRLKKKSKVNLQTAAIARNHTFMVLTVASDRNCSTGMV